MVLLGRRRFARPPKERLLPPLLLPDMTAGSVSNSFNKSSTFVVLVLENPERGLFLDAAVVASASVTVRLTNFQMLCVFPSLFSEVRESFSAARLFLRAFFKA